MAESTEDDKLSIVSGTTEDFYSPHYTNKLPMLIGSSRFHGQLSSPIIGYAGEISAQYHRYASDCPPETQSHPDDDAVSCMSELLLANGKHLTAAISTKKPEGISRAIGSKTKGTQSRGSNSEDKQPMGNNSEDTEPRGNNSEDTQPRGNNSEDTHPMDNNSEDAQPRGNNSEDTQPKGNNSEVTKSNSSHPEDIQPMSVNSEDIQLKSYHSESIPSKGNNSTFKGDNSETIKPVTDEDGIKQQLFSQTTEVSQSILEPSLIVLKPITEHNAGVRQDVRMCKSTLDKLHKHLTGFISTPVVDGREELQTMERISQIQQSILEGFHSTENNFLRGWTECVEECAAILSKIRQGHDLLRGHLAAKVKQKGQTKRDKQRVREEMKMLTERQKKLLNLFQKQQEINKCLKTINLDKRLLSIASSDNQLKDKRSTLEIMSQVTRAQSSPRSKQGSDMMLLDPLSPKFPSSFHKMETGGKTRNAKVDAQMNSQDETQPCLTYSQNENHVEGIVFTGIGKTFHQISDSIETQQFYSTQRKVQSSPEIAFSRIPEMDVSFDTVSEKLTPFTKPKDNVEGNNKSTKRKQTSAEQDKDCVWRRKIQFPERFEDIEEISAQLSTPSETISSKKQKVASKSSADSLFDEVIAKSKLANKSSVLSSSAWVHYTNMVSDGDHRNSAVESTQSLTTFVGNPKNNVQEIGFKSKGIVQEFVEVKPTDHEEKITYMYVAPLRVSSSSIPTVPMTTSSDRSSPKHSSDTMVSTVQKPTTLKKVGIVSQPASKDLKSSLPECRNSTSSMQKMTPTLIDLTINQTSSQPQHNASMIGNSREEVGCDKGTFKTLSEMIESGLLKPGKDLLSITLQNSRFSASLLADGQIGTDEGEYKNPVVWLSKLTGVTATRKFAFKKVCYEGKPLCSYQNILSNRKVLCSYPNIPSNRKVLLTNTDKNISTSNIPLTLSMALNTKQSLNTCPSDNIGSHGFDTSSSESPSVTMATRVTAVEGSFPSLVSGLTKVCLIDNHELVPSEQFLPDLFWKEDFKQCCLGDELWKSIVLW